MKFKQIIVIITWVLFSTCTFAQGKYCKSFSYYKSNKWTVLDTLTMQVRNVKNKTWGNGGSFSAVVPNKETDEILKNKARFVVYDSTLYVNCNGLIYGKSELSDGYAPAFQFGKDKICFLYADKTGNTKRTISYAATNFFLFGLIGATVGAVAADAGQNQNQLCYYIDSSDNQIKKITHEYMENLLADHPDLLKKYKEKEIAEKESGYIILYYLQKLNLLNNKIS